MSTYSRMVSAAATKRNCAPSVRGGHVRLDIHDIDALMAKYALVFRDHFHITKTAYARLLMPAIMGPEVGYVIYLDCDIVCIRSMRSLWNLRQQIKLLGAAVDEAQGLESLKRMLGLTGTSPYFNSGVLLVNLETWRSQDVSGRLIQWIANNPEKVVFADQDAINAELSGDIYHLSRQWNLQLGSIKNIKDLPSDACLLHFNGKRKPWHFGTTGLGVEHFRQAKRNSSWRSIPPDFSYQYYKIQKSITKRWKGFLALRTLAQM